MRECVRQQDVPRCRTGALLVANPHLQTLKIVPMSCGAWDCPNCAPRKRAMWMHKIVAAEPTRFITLTRNPIRAHSPMQAYQQMKEGWPRLLRKIRSKFGAFEFCAFWELHKDGYPHLHVVQKGKFVPSRWLSAVLPYYGFGTWVDIRQIWSKPGCARYIAKELTKMTMFVSKFHIFKRIIWHSQHFFAKDTSGIPQGEEPDAVKISSERPLHKILDDLVIRHGFIVDSDANDQAVTLYWSTDDPDPEGFLAICRQVAYG